MQNQSGLKIIRTVIANRSVWKHYLKHLKVH